MSVFCLQRAACIGALIYLIVVSGCSPKVVTPSVDISEETQAGDSQSDTTEGDTVWDASAPLDVSGSDIIAVDMTTPDGDSMEVDAELDTLPPSDIGTDAGSEDIGLEDAPPGDVVLMDADSEGPLCHSFEGTIQPILETHCVQCHQGEDAALGLQLGSGDALASLVGIPSAYNPGLILVVPNDSDASFLLHKIGASPDYGITMPMLAQPLSDADKEAISAWIDAGATDQVYDCEGEDAGSPPDDVTEDAEDGAADDSVGPEDTEDGLGPEPDASDDITVPPVDDVAEDMDTWPGDTSGDASPAEDTLPEEDASDQEDIDAPPDAAVEDVPLIEDAEGDQDIEGESDAQEDAQEDAWAPPEFPEQASDAEFAGEKPAYIENILDEDVTYIASIGAPKMLLDTSDGLALYDLTLESLEGEFGEIHVTEAYGEHVLVATDSGLYVLFKKMVLLPSPINKLLEGANIVDLSTVPTDGAEDTLWLATDNTLYQWEDGLLSEIGDGDLPTASAQLAYGALYEGQPVTWVASQGWLYALFEEDGQWTWSAVAYDLPVSEMKVDGEGRLWCISDGDVVLRHVDGSWEWLAFPEPIERVLTGLEASDVWLHASGSLYHYEDGLFWIVAGAPGLKPVAYEGTGRFLAGQNASLVRIHAEEPLNLAATWEDDVAPIYEAKCAMCHGPNSVANDLSTMEDWIDNIANILIRVKTDMPANDPPLEPNLTALIEAWSDGGFVP
jgi:hypothetical protein